ncbi:MAG: demethoxyubiquinone hydroxylase family protein [Luminiphilus sp.]
MTDAITPRAPVLDRPAVSVTAAAMPAWLVADVRSDHAGETGAVMIYRGILAVSRDPDIRHFAEHHLATECEHLALIEAILPVAERTKLLWLWRIMGWLTGALPALFGANAVYATIDAVETFVDHHYQEQIDRLEPDGEFANLRELLLKCQQDEIAHRDEARHLAESRPGVVLSCWRWIVGTGSSAAVVLARRF